MSEHILRERLGSGPFRGWSLILRPFLFPLTSALSPSAGERGNPRQSVGDTDALGNRERLTSVLPLPRRGGEGRGEGEGSRLSWRGYQNAPPFRSLLKLAGVVTSLIGLLPGLAAGAAPENLAVKAHASAFEDYQGMVAALANDGRLETRWSGIPGHNVGGWFQLAWDQPVRVGEVVVFQHDRYVKEMDVQVWDSTNQVWVTIEHLGSADRRLPKVVVCRFASRVTQRVRLANITNGPSFSEVQVFEEPYSQPPALSLASDADGHFIGMISDSWGSAPLAGAEVALSGHAKSGPWQAAARSDDHGLFFVPMPLGLSGPVTIATRGLRSEKAQEKNLQVDAADFQYGLTPANLRGTKVALDGEWRFAPDPPAGFWEPGFKDQTWSVVRPPSSPDDASSGV